MYFRVNARWDFALGFNPGEGAATIKRGFSP